ncbi:hypothetical protein LCGC14_1042460 [marine sediment metagenome]|uniref:Uncharacterized protein n=1 Tax=marine sediment metagenome TaxID=412755 RepID=A0A0F9QXK4_9ZZZZ
MCQLISGWISLDGLTVYPGDLVHHERGATIHGISEKVASPWEWTETVLQVRVSPAAKHKGATEAWYKELLRQKFRTRDGAIQWCLAHLSPNVESLYLNGLQSAEGLTLPESIGGSLYLNGLQSAEGLTLPESIGGYLYLNGLQSAEGLTLPESIGGSLDLNGLQSAEGLTLPESIGGYLYLPHSVRAELNARTTATP